MLFRRVALRLGTTVEALGREIDKQLSDAGRRRRLSEYYAELGESEAAKRALAPSNDGSAVPDELVFEAALACQQTGEHEEAVRLYTRVIDLNPKAGAAYNNRGNAYLALRRREEAVSDYKRSLESQDDAVIRVNLAIVLSLIGKKSEAREHLQTAQALDPTYARAYAELGNLTEAVDPAAALSYFQHAIQYAPHDGALKTHYDSLSRLQIALGEHLDAISSLRQMIALSPTSPEVKLWKECIATLLEKWDEECDLRSTRERLQESGRLPLARLVHYWLMAADTTAAAITPTWLLVESAEQLSSTFAVLLLEEPPTAVLKPVDEQLIPQRIAEAAGLVLVATDQPTIAEDGGLLMRYHDRFGIALVASAEVKEALLADNEACRRLLAAKLYSAASASRHAVAVRTKVSNG